MYIPEEKGGDSAMNETFLTRRTTVPELEKIIFKPFSVLDDGFVRLVDYMGSDESIVQSARVSYGKGTKQLNQDRGLIRYLMRHKHTTPFEMCEIKLHIKLPIFIARQWIRHRTANINEYSARYSVLDKEFYVPEGCNVAVQSSENKQGREGILSGNEAHEVLETIKRNAERAYEDYEALLNIRDDEVIDANKQGIARELSRMVLPVNYYTQWYWKIDLHNLFHFLRLRADSHAQYEIREYANCILSIVEKWVPFAYEAFMDYSMNSVHISAVGKEIIKKMIKGESVDQESSGLSKREYNELMQSLDISQEESK